MRGLSGRNVQGEGHCCLGQVVGLKATHGLQQRDFIVLGSAAGRGLLILY